MPFWWRCMERHGQIPILTSRLVEASEVRSRLSSPQPTARGKWQAVGLAPANCQVKMEMERRSQADIGRKEVCVR
jgi:hypothetical protein